MTKIFGIVCGICVCGLLSCGNRIDTVLSIAIHPIKPNIIYIVTDNSVYKTRDSGETWKQLDGGLSRTDVTSIVIDPQLPANIFSGTFADGVYKSADGGRSWHVKNSGLQKGTISMNVQQLVFNPRSSQTLYAGTTVGVFRTTDGGQSWTERMQGMTEINFIVSLAIDPQHPNIVYAGTSGGIFRSVNATESWTKVNTGLVPSDARMASMALGVNVVVVDPEKVERVYAGTTNGLFQTHNRGESWEKIGHTLLTGFISSVVLDPEVSTVVYVGTSHGVYKSQDAGKAWQLHNTGMEDQSVRAVGIHPLDSNILYCGTNGGGLFRSRNAGESWENVSILGKS
ncbi:MAG: hypothetical protein O7F12_15240 [Nitrospirae bacterium]|nr:hypothetical protein [Nitrospirota bacterium]